MNRHRTAGRQAPPHRPNRFAAGAPSQSPPRTVTEAVLRMFPSARAVLSDVDDRVVTQVLAACTSDGAALPGLVGVPSPQRYQTWLESAYSHFEPLGGFRQASLIGAATFESLLRLKRDSPIPDAEFAQLLDHARTCNGRQDLLTEMLETSDDWYVLGGQVNRTSLPASMIFPERLEWMRASFDASDEHSLTLLFLPALASHVAETVGRQLSLHPYPSLAIQAWDDKTRSALYVSGSGDGNHEVIVTAHPALDDSVVTALYAGRSPRPLPAIAPVVHFYEAVQAGCFPLNRLVLHQTAVWVPCIHGPRLPPPTEIPSSVAPVVAAAIAGAFS